MKADINKIENIVLYVCQAVDPSCLGAVKLHKILYYSDMLHYAEHGSPITGATYRKRPFGPTCENLTSAIWSLQKRGAIRVGMVDYFGYQKKQFEAVANAEIAQLTNAEIAIVNEVTEFVCNKNSAKTISELSHNRAWESVEFGEVIPYSSVYFIFPTEVSQEALDWAQREASDLAASGQNSATVVRHDFGDFRSRVLEARRSA